MGKRNAVFLTLSTFLGVVGRESRFVVNVNELKYFFDVGWADILKLK